VPILNAELLSLHQRLDTVSRMSRGPLPTPERRIHVGLLWKNGFYGTHVSSIEWLEGGLDTHRNPSFSLRGLPGNFHSKI